MKTDDFFQLLRRFKEKPIPATLPRHIYIWKGELEDLTSQSPTGLFKHLNLHQLCQSLTKTPISDGAAGRVLEDAIQDWLQKEIPVDLNQRAIVITGIDLLYRYHIPFGVLMQIANENRLIVLVVSTLDISYRPNRPLPSFVQLTPDAVFKHIKTQLPDEAIIGDD